MNVNKIICGDCLEVMKGFPANYFDLTITSPPYDNLRTYNGYSLNNSFNFENIAKELFRVTKQGGVIVWVVGDATVKGSETGTSFRQALYFKEIGFNLHDTMIYEKDSISFPETNRYYQIFEYMFVFSKGKPKSVNLLDDRKNKWYNGRKHIKGHYRKQNGKIVRHNKQNLLKEFGIRFNIWRIANGKNKSTLDNTGNCPAIFPEQLASDHIISWSNEGDIVLDPMCGSGTTCKMAKKSGRKYLGIDISEEYCEIARKRIRAIPELLF